MITHPEKTYEAIQVLKLSGFTTIIAYASFKHSDYLTSLGATHILDRASVPLSDLASTVRTISPDGLPVVYDAISSADTQVVAYDCLLNGGSLAITTAEAPSLTARRESDTASGRDVVQFLANSHLPGQDDIGKQVYAVLSDWLRDGVIAVCFTFIISSNNLLNSQSIAQSI